METVAKKDIVVIARKAKHAADKATREMREAIDAEKAKSTRRRALEDVLAVIVDHVSQLNSDEEEEQEFKFTYPGYGWADYKLINLDPARHNELKNILQGQGWTVSGLKATNNKIGGLKLS